jgi:hypothetical protein
MRQFPDVQTGLYGGKANKAGLQKYLVSLF